MVCGLIRRGSGWACRSRGGALGGVLITTWIVVAAALPAVAQSTAVRADNRGLDLWGWGSQPWAATVELDPRMATAETWTGGDTTGTNWALYSGITWAPFAPLQQDGFRVRGVVVAGRASYDGLARMGKSIVPQRYVSTTMASQALAGWQLRRGRLTLKAFGGVAMGQKQTTPFDPSDSEPLRRIGGVIAIEGWLDLPSGYLQLDMSYAQVDRTAGGRLRGGWRIVNDVSIGPEVSAARTQPASITVATTRFGYGGFARYGWDRGEISTSAGVQHDSTTGASRYLTAQVLTRY